MSKETYDSWTRALSFLVMVIGLVGIVFVVVFWALTKRIELAFLPFFGTLAGVGYGGVLMKEISSSRQGETSAHDAPTS